MTPMIPRLTKSQLADIAARAKENAKRYEQDERDRRTLTGKHTPPPGVCRVCTGRVVADIGFRDDGRCGGPPPVSFIKRWHCEGCGLVYAWAPKRELP